MSGKGDSEIELVSGDYLDLLDPNPALLTPRVIGWHLSQQNRFAGACIRSYSVAEHTILVARRLHQMGEAADTVLAGLHHDDAEAFIGDMTRPLKDQVPAYKDIETKMQVVIWRALELPDIDNETAAIIKQADNWALAAESHYLMPSRGNGWWQTEGLFDEHDADEYRITETLRHSPRMLINPPMLADRWIVFHNHYMTQYKEEK